MVRLTVQCFLRVKTIDGLDGIQILLKKYALSMEDKLAAAAFGRNYGLQMASLAVYYSDLLSVTIFEGQAKVQPKHRSLYIL